MEVGAVKQAFNNEVIQLKKNLNQAKIHVIHKLTRKAKKEVKKGAPEKLKEKFKRQAASAVNEVLIIKKIKPRDIARFTVTHAGELTQHINKPTVDHDKACARLLLHKSLQAKYKHIRNTFSSIPIKDLLMSRQERLKLKREANLDKKMKKDKKKKVVNAEGDWDVEDINTRSVKDVPKSASKKFNESDDDNDDSGDDMSKNDEEMKFDENDDSDQKSRSDDEEDISQCEKSDSDHPEDEEDNNKDVQSDETEPESYNNMESDQESDNNQQQSEKEEELEKSIKPSLAKHIIKQNENTSTPLTFEQLGKNRRKPEVKKSTKAKDIHKNKNLKDKLQTRKFNKDSNESQVKETKIVDPFFITSTGENYMSVAEPRQPDEVKEIHKQGNRKERRAAMFGHVPIVKPRQDFRQNSRTSNNASSGFKHKFNQSDDGYNNKGKDAFRNRNDNDSQYNSKGNQFKNQNDKPFGGKNSQFKGKNYKPGEDRNDHFKGRNDSKFKGRSSDVETKVEKLHPSWEAKKKQSGILPFQGKKTVFDEG